jgi:aconitate hydratase
VDDLLYIPEIRKAIENGADKIQAFIINSHGKNAIDLKLENLSRNDRDIILAGSLINYYVKSNKG